MISSTAKSASIALCAITFFGAVSGMQNSNPAPAARNGQLSNDYINMSIIIKHMNVLKKEHDAQSPAAKENRIKLTLSLLRAQELRNNRHEQLLDLREAEIERQEHYNMQRELLMNKLLSVIHPPQFPLPSDVAPQNDPHSVQQARVDAVNSPHRAPHNELAPAPLSLTGGILPATLSPLPPLSPVHSAESSPSLRATTPVHASLLNRIEQEQQEQVKKRAIEEK